MESIRPPYPTIRATASIWLHDGPHRADPCRYPLAANWRVPDPTWTDSRRDLSPGTWRRWTAARWCPAAQGEGVNEVRGLEAAMTTTAIGSDARTLERAELTG